MAIDKDGKNAESLNFNSESTALSKGKIVQRHRHEFKRLRQTIADLRRKRMKFSKKKAAQKDSRKELTQLIKTMQQEFEEKCKKELAEFETSMKKSEDRKTAKTEAEKIDGPTLGDDKKDTEASLQQREDKSASAEREGQDELDEMEMI